MGQRKNLNSLFSVHTCLTNYFKCTRGLSKVVNLSLCVSLFNNPRAWSSSQPSSPSISSSCSSVRPKNIFLYTSFHKRPREGHQKTVTDLTVQLYLLSNYAAPVTWALLGLCPPVCGAGCALQMESPGIMSDTFQAAKGSVGL